MLRFSGSSQYPGSIINNHTRQKSAVQQVDFISAWLSFSRQVYPSMNHPPAHVDKGPDCHQCSHIHTLHSEALHSVTELVTMIIH